MFRGLINDAKSAVSSVILKYVARASVAVPFVIAAGFALAAGTVMLVERYGHVFAYWSMAGGLAAVGLIAALAVRVKEHEEEVADEIGALFWPTDKNKGQEVRSEDMVPPARVPPPDNVAAFADHQHMRNGSRAWTAVIAIGLGMALAIASAFLVDPFEAKRAVMATLGW